jgi:diguanylate cyclase (GGDEF)-like protein
MKTISSAIRNFFTCAWAKEQPPEILYQIQLFIGLTTIGGTFLVINIIINFLSKNITLLFIPLGLLVSLIIITTLLYRTRNTKRCILLGRSVYLLFEICLVIQETQQKSGILLWAFIFPSLTMCYRIKKGGELFFGLSFVIIIFVLFDDFLLDVLPTTYDIRYSLRFVMVYILIVFFGYLSLSIRENLEKMLKASNDQLSKMAHTDTLTGIPNRRNILKKIENEKSQAQRNQSCFSIILADIDHFKRINDEYGHGCGDRILKELAVFIERSLRKQDVMGLMFKEGEASRWGGEEFLILLPGTNQKGAGNVAEKLRIGIQNHFFGFEEKKLQITMSFGACECRYDEDIYRYIELADQKLYEAKKRGRNRVSL